MNQEERFWDKVTKTETCWLWTGYTSSDNYGRFNVGNHRPVLAHRFAYALSGGLIPDGLQLDHLCRVRNCVNPDHLEVVTNRENTLRGLHGQLITHCPRGHEYTDVNTRFRKNGHRVCRTCHREGERLRRKAVPS